MSDEEIGRMHVAMVAAAAARRRLSKSAFDGLSKTLRNVLDNFGLREEPEKQALQALAGDHLQAREDVKRLAGLLRASATEAPDGTLCWCGDGEVNSYCWGNPHGRSLFCIERSAALSEVGQ